MKKSKKIKRLSIFIVLVALMAILIVFYNKNQTGFLVVKPSLENLTVFVDNKEQTISNEQTQLKLKKGEHSLLISKKNYWPWAQDIQITAQTTTTVHPFFVPQSSSGVFIPQGDAEYAKIMSLFQNNLISPVALNQLSQSQQTFEKINSLDFYKDRTDVVILATGNGVYALEISPNNIQNFQPIYKGTQPIFVKKDNNSLYILDNNNLMLVNY